ncbi:hypothetical protein [Pseudomonas sp. LP_4_YM]|uniref:hypothetical protein n=1 Tax=Pseudomonas sp. LP_4_YM TaxID=2485135 RepID=UPI00105363A4|nr:hypothetical protein [Pseudomonas sp. LP_4_YM]TCT82110.1 hypothetical protein EC913_1664 [Pseudomonas sp. LP_4_YM]
MAYLVMECGSSARGDTNSNSDRDIVCIWRDEFPHLESINTAYGQVMFYSASAIHRMRQKGSLFLVHLDIDGVWLEGDTSLLDEIRGFRPYPDLVKQTQQAAISFIREIAWFPQGHEGFLWLLDSLYVALRNCVYCANAIRGRYVFGFADALEVFGLSQADVSAMLLVREGKYSYRKSCDSANTLPALEEVERVCNTITNHKVKFARGGLTNWHKAWKFDYWDERLIERAILNNEHHSSEFMIKMRHHNYFKNALKRDMICIVDDHSK